MLERHGDPPKSRIIVATEGFVTQRWKKREGEVDHPVQYMPLEEVLVTQGDGPHKQRMPK